MATVAQDPNLEEDKKKKEQQQAGPLTQVSASGATQQVAAPSPTQNYTGASKQQPGSGRFTNIQQYIKANQGAGKQLASGIGKKGTDASQQIAQNVQKAKGLTGDIQSEQQRLGQVGQITSQIQQDPTQLVQDPNQLQQVTKLREGQNLAGRLGSQAKNYLQTGGQSLEEVRGLGQQLGTESGRFDALRSAFGRRPGYSGGEQRLDQVLLQSDPNDPLGNLQRNLTQQAQLGSQELQQTQTQLGTGISNIESQTDEAQKALLETLGVFDNVEGEEPGGELGKLYSALSEAEASAEAQRAQDVESYKQQLREGTFTDPEFLETLGLSEGDRLYGLDLSGLESIISGGDDITMADVAEEDQLNRLDALRQLAGLEEEAYQDVLGEKEGGVIPSVDQELFQQELQTARQGFETDTKSLLSAIDASANRSAATLGGGGGFRADSAIRRGSDAAFNLQQNIKNMGYNNITDLPPEEALAIAEQALSGTYYDWQNGGYMSVDDVIERTEKDPVWGLSFGTTPVVEAVKALRGYNTRANLGNLEDDTFNVN